MVKEIRVSRHRRAGLLVRARAEIYVYASNSFAEGCSLTAALLRFGSIGGKNKGNNAKSFLGGVIIRQ